MSEECPVCLETVGISVLPCAHQLCLKCAGKLTKCPICRTSFASPIEVFVISVIGKHVKITIFPDDTIGRLKEKLQDSEGYPPSEVALVFNRKHVEDDYTLAHYGIKNESVLTCLLRLRGD